MAESDDEDFDVQLNQDDRIDLFVRRNRRTSGTPTTAMRTLVKPWRKHYQACLSKARSLQCPLSQMQVVASTSLSSWETTSWNASEVAIVFLDDAGTRDGAFRSRIDCPWVVVRKRRPVSSPFKWISSSPAKDDDCAAASSEAAAEVLGPMFHRHFRRRLESKNTKGGRSTTTSSSQWTWGISSVARGFQSVLALMDLTDYPPDCAPENKHEYDEGDDAAIVRDSSVFDEDDDDALHGEDINLGPEENIINAQLVMECCQLILDEVSRQHQRRRHVTDDDGDAYRWIQQGQVLLLSLEQPRDQDASTFLDTFRDLCHAASTEASLEESNDEDNVRRLLGHLNNDDLQLTLETLVKASGGDFYCAKVSEDVLAISTTSRDENQDVDTVDVTLFQLHKTRRRLEKRLEYLETMVDNATHSALALNKKKVKGPALIYQLKRRKLALESRDQCANSLLAVDQTLLTIESRRHDGALLDCWQNEVIPTLQALRRDREEEFAFLEEWDEEMQLQQFLGNPSCEDDVDASGMLGEWQQEDDAEPLRGSPERRPDQDEDDYLRWDGGRSHSKSPASKSPTLGTPEKDAFRDVASILDSVPVRSKENDVFHDVPSILDTAPTVSSDAEDSFEDALVSF